MKYNYNLDCFLNLDANSYYLLGAFMSDGCVYNTSNKKSKAVCLTSKDIDWLNDIKNLICPEIIISNNRLNIYSNKLANWLINQGCTERKSLNLKMPIVPDNFMPDFIRGIMDGDGSIYLSKSTKKYKEKKTVYICPRSYICSSSLSFITSLYEYLNQINIKTTFYIRNRNISYIDGRKINSNNPHYRLITTNSKNTKEFLETIYYPNHKISLFRKRQIANQIINEEYEKIQISYGDEENIISQS